MKRNIYFLFLIIALTFMMACTSDSYILDKAGSEVLIAEKGEAEENPQEPASIEKAIILDQGGVIITAKELAESTQPKGINLNLEVENNSDKDLALSLDTIAVNHYMVTPWLSAVGVDGGKTLASITLLSTDLSRSGIKDIGEIAMKLSLFDPDTNITEIESDEIVINTNHYSQVDSVKMDDGIEILNKNGVRIVARSLEELSDSGYDLILFMENNTDQNIHIQCDSLSIDGHETAVYLSTTVNSECMVVDEITLFANDLREAGIDHISKIKVQFFIEELDTFTELLAMNPVTFTFEE